MFWKKYFYKKPPLLLFIGIILGLILLITIYRHPIRIQKFANTTGVSLVPSSLPSDVFQESIAVDSSIGYQRQKNIVPSSGETAAQVDQKIIKTASLTLLVEKTIDAIEQIKQVAYENQGFVASSSVSQKKDGNEYGEITIRIPVDSFENVLEQIKSYATLVKYESTHGQDVTEEYTDLEARLRNSKAQEERYLEILTQAKTVEDILKVERELQSTRQTIEQLQGQIQYLENQTGYSTISVSLSEETLVSLPTESFRPWSAVKEAVQTLIILFQQMIIHLVWIIIIGGGVLIPIAIIVWVIIKLFRRGR
ncbi:hypothetical protein CO172_02670 [Candidatus Uhrbacteria bacterium CG_4_9_14_3_um_filter_36_7]|uniref:DUF4349 domain-containing protein n=1 Tax=Candidatus Uhrbacteria bacterium CG_4_9_14_3_um_filter_36_7 TaxID=1975033 RepID=A0A2M7XH53_9BACT|nr:MAG: hypothetical protein CO172_02670 [Candidatus Uhrbacteria bacterium CG_4_9_14_3_um_filter_36_7]